MLELLAATKLFGECTAKQLKEVNAVCERQAFTAGERICEAGAPAHHLYVVESGVVELRFAVTAFGAPQEITIDRKLRGDVVGWSAIVEPRVFTLSAIAVDEATLLRIRGTDLAALCEDDAFGRLLMSRLANIIGERFNVMQQVLVDIAQQHLDRLEPRR